MKFFNVILITFMVCECKTSELTSKKETEDFQVNEIVQKDNNCTPILTNLKINSNSTSEELKIAWESNTLEQCNFQYRIKIAEVFQANGNISNINVNNTFYRFTNIKPCTNYNITVELLQNNDSNVLAKLSESYETAALNQIEKLNISTTTSAIRLSWKPHKYAALCKIRYIITANKEIPYFRYVNHTEHWIKNLHSCTEYNVSITPFAFRNKFDDKTPHLMHSVTTLPEKVSNLTLKVDNATTVISWIPPDNHKCIKKYRITINGTDSVPTTNTYLESSESLYCTEVKVQPVSNNNKSGASVYILKPGPVQNLNGIATDTSITAKWNLPEDSTCVLDYLVGIEEEEIEDNTVLLEYTFNNLIACKQYKFRVAARSKNTHGEYTSYNLFTLEPNKVGPVENLSVTDGSNLVIWQPPQNAGACSISYMVEVYDDKNEKVYTESTSETNHKISFDSWIGCMSYIISVTPNLASSPGEAIEKPVKFSKATNPPNCKDIEVKQTQAVLECELDDCDTNKCIIEKIVVTCEAPESENNGSWVKWNATSTKIIEDDVRLPVTVTVENISEFTSYSCYGIVVNSAGDSVKSDSVPFLTDEGVPDAPDVQVVTATNKSVYIKWTEPEKLPGILQNYHITIESHGPQYFTPDDGECIVRGKDNYRVTLEPSTYEHEFLNAFPKYNYSVYIKASTQAGYGPQNEVEIQTEAGIPNEPRNINFTTIEGTTEDYNVNLTLTWNFPCDANGDVKYFKLHAVGISYADKNKNNHTKEDIIYIRKPIDLIYGYTIVGLQPAFSYTVDIKTVLIENLESNRAVVTFTSPESYPEAPILSPISEVLADAFTLEWNEPPQKNGILLNYTLTIMDDGPMYWIPQDEVCFTENKNYSFNIPSQKKSFTFQNATPSHRYSTFISASTIIGTGPNSEILPTITLDSVPEQVRNFTKNFTDLQNEKYIVNVTFSFKHPCNTYGLFKQFAISLFGNRPDSSSHYESSHWADIQEEYKFSWELRAEYNYILTVQVETEIYNSTVSELTFTSPSGVPPIVTKNISAPMPHGSTQANFTFDCNLFDEKCGKILYYALILGENNHEEKSLYGFWNGTDETWPSIDNTFSKEIQIQPYQATPNFWNPFKDDCYNYTFVFGNVSHSEFNKPLQDGIMYTLKVRGFTKHGYRDTPTVTFEIPAAINLALILGLIFGILGTGVLLGFIFILWRKRRQWQMKKESIKSIPLTPIPVSIKQFPQYYNELKNNSDKLKHEFTFLGNKSTEVILPGYDGILPENKKKNRYTNIIPYDETRVKLMDTNDNYCTSDYINASYIQGYSGTMEYIATQGPLEHTCLDFWKMVIQENSSLIVMVAQFVEQNKDKCYKYFPNNHENMELESGIAVRCCTELNFKTHIVRTLLVQKDLQQWTVTHLQFTDWPDFGCPVGTEVILEFCQLMREHAERNSDPIIIHCSAGVGRTGTLIALDIILQAINFKRDIDIFGTVLNLRRDRKNMVQTEKQYLYIHSCINDAIENPAPTQCDISKEPIYENLEDIKNSHSDNNTKESKF